MLWTPQKGRMKVISNVGIVGTAPSGTGVVSNATTLLDGAVTELISAANNTQDSWGISLYITATGAGVTAAESCMDIPSDSEHSLSSIPPGLSRHQPSPALQWCAGSSGYPSAPQPGTGRPLSLIWQSLSWHGLQTLCKLP